MSEPLPPHVEFAEAVHAGLSATPKTLPCRFFYDHEGSLLFEEICDLPEYYLTRTEDAILRERADEIAAAAPEHTTLVELGSGSARKTRRLIAALLDRAGALRYVPIDISREMLEASADALRREFPRLIVDPIVDEYFAALRRLAKEDGPPRLMLFLGSNLGNFTDEEAVRFLSALRQTMRPADRALIGLDLRKEPAVLEAAYDDSAGVTARFNLNILARINRELGGDFDLSRFRHRALYNAALGRVEMHLVSLEPQCVEVRGRLYRFEAGESIHTENSYKYTVPQVRELSGEAGLALERTWTDAQHLFSLHLLRPVGRGGGTLPPNRNVAASRNPVRPSDD